MTARPLNYSTTVDVHRTAGEIQRMLAAHGASMVALRYDSTTFPTGVTFVLPLDGGERAYALPVDVEAMLAYLNAPEHTATLARARKGRATMQSPEQAARVAWRVIKDWLEAQLALIAAQMASLDTVMLPYLIVDRHGTTLAQRYRDAGLPALEAGEH